MEAVSDTDPSAVGRESAPADDDRDEDVVKSSSDSGTPSSVLHVTGVADVSGGDAGTRNSGPLVAFGGGGETQGSHPSMVNDSGMWECHNAGNVAVAAAPVACADSEDDDIEKPSWWDIEASQTVKKLGTAMLLIDDIHRTTVHDGCEWKSFKISETVVGVQAVIFAGVVRAALRYENRTVLKVDDGTGVVPCVLYPDDEHPSALDLDVTVDTDAVAGAPDDSFVVGGGDDDTAAAASRDPIAAIESKLTVLAREMSDMGVNRCPAVGDLVFVHGKVTEFDGKKSVIVEFVYPGLESNVLNHVNLLRHVYAFYEKPFPRFVKLDDFRNFFFAAGDEERERAETILRDLYRGSLDEA